MNQIGCKGAADLSIYGRNLKRLPHLILVPILSVIAILGCNEPDGKTQVASKQSHSMNKPYIPPTMPPFPTNYYSVMETLAPYYRDERPLDYFFEMYVMDVINELPEATARALRDFSSKHPKFFNKKHNGDWRKYVVNELHLSDTIEIAIWDLWIRNSAIAQRDGWQYHPWHYAKIFADNCFADGSRVDVWEGNALEEAKRRIDTYRKTTANKGRRSTSVSPASDP